MKPPAEDHREPLVSELTTQPGSQPETGPGTEPLLRTEGLTKYFKIGNALSRRTLHAVDDVSLSIGQQQIVALAGESGCGKSTIARLLAKIYKPTSGEIYFQGKPLSAVGSRQELLRYSGRVPMVFQDPFSSTNPVFRVSHGVMRGIKLHRPGFPASSVTTRHTGSSRSSGWLRRPRCCSAIRTSSAAASGSGSVSPRPWPCGRS